MRLFTYITLLLMSLPLFGQFTSLRKKTVMPDSGIGLQLDSALVDPATISLDTFVQGRDFRFENDSLFWLIQSPLDSLDVFYRILSFNTLYFRKSPDLIYPVFSENPFNYIPESETIDLNYGTLNTAGNISRGLGFGNAQDVVVNSNLNLRINGKLANDVDVLAVISDENNPIQPEGNTQQIQDFDQVYITLHKDSNTITVGDFLMQRPRQSYFMNYYKKSRGLQYENIASGEKWHVRSGLEAAISRGRFSRNRIDGIEGNSGPYRLSGENGETFIIIISGTETVYLDGKKLTRGEDHDYVINYNTGEISFTPAVLITRYSRIVVEFQYSDRNYARSVVRTGTDISNGNWNLYTHFFNEMDLRNQPFQQSLEGYDSLNNISAGELLGQSGDQNAFISNIRQLDNYNPDRIMYRKTLVGAEEIFVYAVNPSEDSVFYQVVFSNLGNGNGNYVQIPSSANGRVFEYRGPGLGDYAPLEVLIAPQRMNMWTTGMVHSRDKQSTGLEFTLTDCDKNTFSNRDDADNQGYGIKFFTKNKRYLKDTMGWKFSYLLENELVSNNFQYVERYRDVEFDRDWNKVLINPDALNSLTSSMENISKGTLALEKSEDMFIRNSTAAFLRPGNFEGYNNHFDAGYKFRKFKSGTGFELMNTKSGTDSSALENAFYSLYAFGEQDLVLTVLGANFRKEESAFRQQNPDSLLGQSYAYNQAELYLKNREISPLKYRLSGSQRKDERPGNEGFAISTLGRSITATSSYTNKKSDMFSFNTTYRNLEILDTTLSDKNRENTVQSRIEIDYSFLRKMIRSRSFYQVGAGQEQRREFQYLQVQAGNGIYIWNDYDSNGIKTLNEFEIASDFDRSRADYIKIYIPVPGFITTNSNRISETLEINPAVWFKSGEKKSPFPARFFNLSTLILEKKTLPSDLLGFLNPYQSDLNDTSLINSNQSFRNTIFYNRSNPVYGLEYTYMNNQSKVLLTNGFDSRKSFENILKLRINLSKRWTVNTSCALGERMYNSQFFSIRNYRYDFLEIQPTLQYQYQNKYRVELRSTYFTAENLPALGGESTRNIEIASDFKYTRAGSGFLQASLSFVKVNYLGNVGTALGYELLRGLQNGNNATWNLSYQQKISGSIQVVVSYDGRKSEEAPMIHIGRLVARYLF